MAEQIRPTERPHAPRAHAAHPVHSAHPAHPAHPAHEKKEKPIEQPSMTLVFGGFVVAMILAVLVRLSRSPSGPCVYHHVYRRSTCKGKLLHEIPEDVPDGVQTLLIGDHLDKNENTFSVLLRSNLSRFRHVQELALVHCGIEEIEAEAFADLIQLKHLDIGYNRITIFSEASFRGLKTMDVLHLTHNPVHIIEDFTFRGLTVRLLALSDNPHLNAISSNAFSNATVEGVILKGCNLEVINPSAWSLNPAHLLELSITDNLRPLSVHLDAFEGYSLNSLVLCRNGLTSTQFLNHGNHEVIWLDGNPLVEENIILSNVQNRTRVLSLSNIGLTNISRLSLFLFPNLEVLNMSGNNVTVFDVRALSEQDRLISLDLSKNRVVDFEGNFSSDLPKLETLLMNDNEVQTIPSDVAGLFSHLNVLRLRGNPLHCNCELRWLIDWWTSVKGQLKKELPFITCQTPENNNKTQFTEHLFECRAPHIYNETSQEDVDQSKEDRQSLVCSADGDPAPTIYWTTPSGREIVATAPIRGVRNVTKSSGRVTVGARGNYTCRAMNVAGEATMTIDVGSTEEVFSSGLKAISGRSAPVIEILATPQGFIFTAVLLVALGVIFKHQ